MTGTGDPAVQLREHLVDAVARLLADRSASGITTRDIASAAGVSGGVLYNYFADKNELLTAALVRHFESVVAQSHGDLPVAGTRTVAENLLSYGEAIYHLSQDAIPMIAGLVTEPVLLHRVMAEIHRPGQGILPFLDRIGEYLAAEQGLGRIADVDLPATMALLTGACATLTMRVHLGLESADPGQDDEAREQIQRMIQVLIGGIAIRPDPA